jgi:subtilisin family serine protease
MKKLLILLSLIFFLGYESPAAGPTASTPNFSKIDWRLQGLVGSGQGARTSSLAPVPLNRTPYRLTSNGTKLYGVIVYSTNAAEAKQQGIEVNTVEPQFFTAEVTADQLALLSTMTSVQYIEAPRILKPLLDKSVHEIGADSVHEGLVNGTPYNGDGVIVGIIDTGIDWKHLDFRQNNDTTKSRILFIWDQTASGGAHPSGFSYGAEYTQAQINDELGATPPHVVKEEDTDGHGTHVAGIAAGDGSSSSSGFIGVAPHADIIVVKAGNGSFGSNNVIDGMAYIVQKAQSLGEPFVINMSLGGQDGPHDGTTAEEEAVDDESSSSGRAIVIAAGNDGDNPIHADTTLAQNGTATIQCNIPTYTPTSGNQNDYVIIDLWCRHGDQFSISVRSPNGNSLTAPYGASGNSAKFSSTNDGYINISDGAFNSIDNSDNDEIQFFDEDASKPPVAGTWTITVTATTVAKGGSFEMWISGSSITGNDGSTPVFSTGAKFSDLVGEPGTADEAITVGSYETKFIWPSIKGGNYQYSEGNRLGNFSTFSSMGPTRDGREKPEVCAPGQAIASAMSSAATFDSVWIQPDDKHVIDQGTSMATPHVAGLAALMLQANPSLSPDQIKSILMATARQDSFTTDPNRWGAGKISATGAMRQSITAVQKKSATLPETFSLSQNYPNPFNPTTSISYMLPSAFHGNVTLRVFNLLGQQEATLVNQVQSAGGYSVSWDAKKFASGVYYYVLKAGTYSSVKKMILLK